MKLNNSLGSDLASIENTDEEHNGIEAEILNFCTKQVEKVRAQLNRAYTEDKEVENSEETTKLMKKLTPAKLALAQIIRAIKKKNYMILQSEQVPEVDQIKPVIPEIVRYHSDLRQLRANQRKLFKTQTIQELKDQ